MNDKKPLYDVQLKNRATLRGSFRGVVCVYLVYMAVNMVKGAYSGATTMTVATAYLIAAAFTAVAAVFGAYAWRQYKRDLAAAVLPENSGENDSETK